MDQSHRTSKGPHAHSDHSSENSYEDVKREDNGGPPSFYEEDVEKYMKKFDDSIKKRQEFKLQTKNKNQFRNIDKNSNVESMKLQSKAKTILLPTFVKGRSTRNLHYDKPAPK